MFRLLTCLIILAWLLHACSLLKKQPTADSDIVHIQDSALEILFLGDIDFGESYQLKNEERGRTNILTKYGYDYSFEKLTSILELGDMTIGNYESTVITLTESPLEELKTYVHRGDSLLVPQYLQKYGINVVSLANNHAMDYGIEGLEQTKDYLSKGGIQSFGAGANLVEAEKPFVRKFSIQGARVNVYVLGWMSYSKSYAEKYKFYANSTRAGVNHWDQQRVLAQIKEIKAKDSLAFIIAFPHWGSNYKWRSKQQQQQAYAIIDAGADVIIGHGAHMIQEIEKYQHKWICYNMGNFVFNSPGRYAKEKVDPYSYTTLLKLKRGQKEWKYTLELYPIWSDNKRSNYQSFPLEGRDFLEMYELLLDKSLSMENTYNSINIDTINNIITLY